MTTIAQLATVAAPLNDELMARYAEVANAIANQTREAAIETINRIMPAITEAMRQAQMMVTTAMQIIAEWMRNNWPALYWSPEYQYQHGTPHQRHVAWRKLKRAGVHLPNPAHRFTPPAKSRCEQSGG